MARNTSVSLGEHFEQFIARQIDVGRFGSASEVIRAGLRLLEDNEDRLAALRRALREGEQSGRADYGYEAFIEELDQRPR
jgi:antitoxin ParD1/3/4